MTVSAVRGIPARYAVYLGVEMPELLALVGGEVEPVLNCGEVIREFSVNKNRSLSPTGTPGPDARGTGPFGAVSPAAGAEVDRKFLP